MAVGNKFYAKLFICLWHIFFPCMKNMSSARHKQVFSMPVDTKILKINSACVCVQWESWHGSEQCDWKSIIEVNVRMNSVPELGSGTRVTRLEFHWDWNFWNWNFYAEILKCSFLQRLSFPKVPEIGTTANFFIYLIPTIFSQKLCHLSHEKFIESSL